MEIPAQTNIPLRHALVVVTGASTGIGAATARELAKRGFHVLAGVRRDADADAIRSANVEPSRLDITNEAEIAALVKHITDDPERRPLRALVNNAGIAVNAPVEALPLSEWRRLFDVNLFGHIAMTQALLPAVPTQNSISREIRGLRRVRCDEMHELSRTPATPDGARQSGQ